MDRDLDFLVIGQTPFDRTSNRLEHQFTNIYGFERVNLVVITFEHSIFGFEGTDLNNPSSQDLLNCSSNRIKHNFV